MKKIAIIEDDAAIAQMYKIKLESAGYDVRMAKNGALGYELIQEFVPDMVLLDLMMPEMTGDQMLEKIRAHDWGKNLKVIVMTNVSPDEAKPKVAHLGVHEFIVKANTTPRQVLEIVQKSL